MIGLATFLAVSNQGGGNDLPSSLGWLLVIAACAGAVVLSVVMARFGSRPWRSAWYGAGAAVSFALVAAFMKSTTTLESRVGFAHLFTHFEPYAIAIAGLCGLFLTQNAFHAGPITASQAALVIVDPIASIVIGVGLFGDNLRGSLGALAADAFALAVMSAGLFILCHSPLIVNTTGRTACPAAETPKEARRGSHTSSELGAEWPWSTARVGDPVSRLLYVSTYLDGILAWHRARAADGRHVERLTEEAGALGKWGFSAQLRRFAAGADGLCAVPAARGGRRRGLRAARARCCHRRSEETVAVEGDLALGLDPAGLAAEYERGGAACLSVLTDQQFFAGSPEDLVGARAATSLPVLRKDFTVCEADVCDARLMGADCVLLIAAALDDDLLARLMSLARSLGMDALLEVHDESEAARALGTGASSSG